MATPTITNPFSGQELSTCEATTGWSGDTFSLESGIKKQGSNSLTCQMTVNGSNAATFTPAASVDLSGEHIRCWYQSGLIAYIDNVANAGVEFWISDGTYTHRWTIGGSDDWKAGWVNMVIYAESTPTSGYNAAFDFTAVTSMGFVFNTTAKPRGVDNFWVDYLRYGDGLTATGGTAFTSGNYITLDDIAVVDETNGYGLVVKDEESGKIKLYGDVNIGNGATTTYYREDDTTATFVDTNVSPTLYKFLFQGSGCNVQLNNFNIDAFSQTLTFDANEANINAFTMDGGSVSLADAVYFKSGQDIQNVVFNACDQIDPSTATFKYNSIKNSTDTGGALLWPSDDTNISDITFTNCDNGVEYDASSDSTPNFSNMVFDDVSGNYDVNNTSGGSVTIPLTGTSNANSYTGSTVTFSASVTLTFTVKDTAGTVIEDARINIVNASTKAELYQIETNASGIATQSHTYSGDLNIEGWCRQFDLSGTDYIAKDWAGTIDSNGFNILLVLEAYI